MKDIDTVMVWGRSHRLLLLATLLCTSAQAWADDAVTRTYMLKYTDVANVSRVINIAVRDLAKTRVIGGEGKRLVIRDTADQQDAIAQILPILDQPTTETDPDKIQMTMLNNTAQYMRQQKLAMKAPPSGAAPTAVRSNAPSSNERVATYDKLTSTKPYKSIYASDDAKLLKKPRIIFDEPILPSLTALQLKGIFKGATGSSLALLDYEGVHYVARDGGLYQYNKTRVKNVTSQVLKDRVILVGLDRIPREIKFKSSL